MEKPGEGVPLERTEPDELQKPDYVYSLHGIRTNAFWHAQIAEELRATTKLEVG